MRGWSTAKKRSKKPRTKAVQAVRSGRKDRRPAPREYAHFHHIAETRAIDFDPHRSGFI